MSDTWPIYRYGWAPEGLATRRQLRATGLRPGGQPIVGEIRWTKKRPQGPIESRVAYLYRIDRALPKREATPAQLVSLAKCIAVRSTCPKCSEIKDYCISHALGSCNDCYERTQTQDEARPAA
jgi:hypothetical protein